MKSDIFHIPMYVYLSLETRTRIAAADIVCVPLSTPHCPSARYIAPEPIH
jgi:hypothetical protein